MKVTKPYTAKVRPVLCSCCSCGHNPVHGLFTSKEMGSGWRCDTLWKTNRTQMTQWSWSLLVSSPSPFPLTASFWHPSTWGRTRKGESLRLPVASWEEACTGCNWLHRIPGCLVPVKWEGLQAVPLLQSGGTEVAHRGPEEQVGECKVLPTFFLGGLVI